MTHSLETVSKLESLVETGAWRVEEAESGIAFLVFDLPAEKVNKLSEAVLRDLERILEALEKEADLEALIVWGGKEDSGTFIAGADIHEIRAVTDQDEATRKARRGQSILGRFAALPAVTVAAIHGTCLGGGTELALACDLRLASNSPKTQIGLPEVQLGILPGFGGTQRLPRLVGLAAALPPILTGKPLDVRKAYRLGVVDAVAYPALLRREAVRLARTALREGGKRYRPRRPRRPLFMRIAEALPLGRALIRRSARRDVLRRAGAHYPAPLQALESATRGFGLPLERGLELEARLVGELVVSRTAKNLIDLFLSSQEARKSPAERPGAVSRCTAPGARVGLLGAGVMGGSLAALLGRKGFRVRMKDIEPGALETGLRRIHELYRARRKSRRMTRSEMENALGAMTVTLDYSGFERVALVIEAVVENMDVKKQVLREVEERLPQEAIFASNTSALSITELAAASARPERVVGLHFFNPVDRMMLVEVIRGEKTAEEAVVAAEEFARRVGKIPVRCRDAPGFVVNRILAPYLNEAVRLFEEGYSPGAVDAFVRAFGMPMGPFELIDEVGLDVAAKVGRILHEAFGERARPSDLLSELVASPELLGRKSGKGFYLHGGKRRIPNPQVLGRGGAQSGDFRPEEPDLWLKRLVYPMVNEAAWVLQDRVAERPSMVDLAMVMGTGFAPFRGGPLRYADTVGPSQVADGLRSLREPRLQPCDLLERLAREDRRFYSLEGVEEAGAARAS